MATCIPFFADSPLKRKCEESDAVIELFDNVSLSPSAKRLRQDFGSTSYSNEFCRHLCSGSDVVCPPDVDLGEVPTDSPVPEIDLTEQLSEPVPACPASDERALVLYKPVHTPLFLGGPSAGSQLLVNSQILSSGICNASSLVHGGNDHHMQWLQDYRKGERVSSDMDVIEETTSRPRSAQVDRLAVVPWVSSAPTNMCSTQAATEAADRDIDDMCGDVEAMEDDCGSNVGAVHPQVVHPQLNSNSTEICYEPWQQYGVPQPQYNSVMWSH